jgi:hypothetical protein
MKIGLSSLLRQLSLLDIAHVSGANPGGLKKFYICLLEDVLAIPTADVGTNVVSTAITCKTGKNFVTWYFTPDTGKLTTSVVGETDGKSRESLIEALLPGLTKEQELELDKVINCPVVIILETNRGEYRILGDMDRGALIDKTDATTGGTMAERGGIPVSFKYSSPLAPLYYTAAIPLTPAA